MSSRSVDRLIWRSLDSTALSEIVAVHAASLADLPDPSLVRRETPAFFAGILSGGGEAIGAFDDDRLVAYGILQVALEEGDDPHRLGLFSDPRVAKLAGAAVTPEWRGNGLQRELIRRRAARAAELGYRQLYATAAPGNVPSWVSLLRGGFVVAALMRRYGGLLRYLLAQGDGFETRPGPRTATILRPDDEAGQTAALAAGLLGIAAAQDAAGRPLIVFAGDRHG